MSLDDPLEVELVPTLSDNYAFLIRDDDTDTVGVVDPGDAAPVEAALAKRGWTPNWVLLTHHHGDHIDGAERIRQVHGAKIAGAAADAHRLPNLDVELNPDQDWDFGAQLVEIFDSPGHTVGHISFHFPRAKTLFAGDVIFVLGCGRLIEGGAQQLWSSLQRYSELPPETRVYCGHEYTLANARFAASIEVGNAALTDHIAEIEQTRAAGAPTVPTTIGRELATNPFMRAQEPTVKEAVGMPEADAVDVFAEIRRRKDNF